MKTTIKELGKNAEAGGYYEQGLFWRAYARRDEDGGEVKKEDEEDFIFYGDAESYAESMEVVGYRGVVEEVRVSIDDLKALEDGDMVSTRDIWYKTCRSIEIEEVFDAGMERGEEITGSVVIKWNWEKYVGYCRNLEEIGIAGEFPFHDINWESDLITGNEERVIRSNLNVLLSRENLEASEDKAEAIELALLEDGWKWNYFKNNPDSKKIQQWIKDKYGDHEEG